MSREDPQLRVRIPSEMKRVLEERAANNKRSLTAEITDRLRVTLLQDMGVGYSHGYTMFLEMMNAHGEDQRTWKEKYEECLANQKSDAVTQKILDSLARIEELIKSK
ncbi:Arc family DNA-binding protein [Serratia fonticola]|uniref:Arc family DNA-binding protein n=1 Tax=Serratia fonticola TaxID=47917 RepID=UPI0016453344|nr:Arc family DNA-binding protein [Serratia fonticola]MBC3251248.1 Arc family DNA-binding protein [Serratia fonticola]